MTDLNQTQHKRDLLLVDGSAPFFVPVVDGHSRNWSKAPLPELAEHGKISTRVKAQITQALSLYCQRVKAAGYSAITFDDLAHLTLFDFYPYRLSRTVHSYQKLFRKVFKIAQSCGLKIFITTDIMFWNPHIESHTRGRDRAMRELLCEAIERLFDLFPMIDGVVTRIGEPDGEDVVSAFKSRLTIRSARQCNRWLKNLLPVFEAQQKLLIFRTWGLGAYSIGDLNWNRKTLEAALAGIESSALVLSHKYGAGDFFRYQPLNDYIPVCPHMQIIELQARREYEGFGLFPAYVGRQYEQIRNQLQSCRTLRGVMVWCQTGGWSHFDRLSFLDDSSPWNELNAQAVAELFTGRISSPEILQRFATTRFPEKAVDQVVELVNGFDQLIDELWYFAPFARQSFWFRRVSVPPLLWIFWDTVLVNRALRLLFLIAITNPKQLRQGDLRQRKLIRRLRELVSDFPSEQEPLTMALDSFELLIALRRFYLGKAGRKREEKIKAKVRAYRKRYPKGFQIECDFSPFHIRWVTTGFFFSLFLRRQPGYRLFDRCFLIPLSGWMFALLKRWQRHRFPGISEGQTAGLETFFR